MSRPGSLLWFARFEARLAWRDALSMLSGGRRVRPDRRPRPGRPTRRRKLALGLIALAIVLHGVAFLVLYSVTGGVRPDLPTLVIVTAGILLSGSAMLAQAMESVTRIFYIRSDLELILSAPVQAGRLFAVRIAAMALSAALMAMLVIGPFIDVLAWRSGVQWLGAYGVLIAVSLTSTGLAVALTILLFRTLGPRRTRLGAQIAAAIIGGMFVIGLQVAAMLSTGTLSRLAFLTSPQLLALVPDIQSAFWYPARAALGDWYSLVFVLGGSVVLFLAVTARYAPRFADYALTASSRAHKSIRERPGDRQFRVGPAASALRLKERRLLLRDPWLMSQSLMQLLYLIPPALLLGHSLGTSSTSSVLVPVLIMSAGQLAGGLAWLTISGEDAPDLVISAPMTASGLLRAKVEVVLQCVGVVLLPFAALLAFISASQALVMVMGSAAAAASATSIQLWFRSQSKRSHFRRRHTSSRIATLSEALVSITWAAAGTAAAVSASLAAIAAGAAVAILCCVRALAPRAT
jgi:ABC-2 type transport system permease protein